MNGAVTGRAEWTCLQFALVYDGWIVPPKVGRMVSLDFSRMAVASWLSCSGYAV